MPKIEIPFLAVNANMDYAVLTGKRTIYPFADGKRTSDVPTATTITTALQGNGFALLNVKIEGSVDPLPDVTDEAIKAACAAMKPLLIRFKDCKVAIYSIDGLKMSATASGVELVNPSK